MTFQPTNNGAANNSFNYAAQNAVSTNQQNQNYKADEAYDDDFLLDEEDDLELDLDMDLDEEYDAEIEAEKNHAMMLGNFIEAMHEEVYSEHKLSEVIELFATMASVAKKYGNPFEKQAEIEKVLKANYSAEEVDEFIDVMQQFQEFGEDAGVTCVDGSPFRLENLSDEMIEDLFAEADEIAKEEEEDFAAEGDLAMQYSPVAI